MCSRKRDSGWKYDLLWKKNCSEKQFDKAHCNYISHCRHSPLVHAATCSLTTLNNAIANIFIFLLGRRWVDDVASSPGSRYYWIVRWRVRRPRRSRVVMGYMGILVYIFRSATTQSYNAANDHQTHTRNPIWGAEGKVGESGMQDIVLRLAQIYYISITSPHCGPSQSGDMLPICCLVGCNCTGMLAHVPWFFNRNMLRICSETIVRLGQLNGLTLALNRWIERWEINID